jgi:hypothetical protein
MFHDVKSPTRPTLISQGVGVSLTFSLTLTQREGPSSGQQKASRLLLAQKPRHFFLPLMGDVVC